MAKTETVKEYLVTYRSRYYPYEGTRSRRVKAPSKSWIRQNWYALMETDEYTIVKTEEVK